MLSPARPLPNDMTRVEGRASAARKALVPALAIGFVAMAILGLRSTIVRVEPRMATLFELIGLPVNLIKFQIVRTSARIVLEGDRRFLVVDGEVANPTAETRVLPPLKVNVRGADGQAIYSWTARAPRQRIEAGEKAAFSARLASPPADGADVVVEIDRSEEKTPPPASPGSAGKTPKRRS